MNKIKQNKITFLLILSGIAIIFSSLTVLSLPVLFNYESKVTLIEKNFYKDFKIYLKSSGEISYKPFPKPHLLVENASLSLSNPKINNPIIETSNLKIFISLKDIYLRSFKNLLYTEISRSNLEIKVSDLKELRNHLYLKVNNPIIFRNCKIFLKNKNNEVILISPINKVSYKINNKAKLKNFIIDGEIFGLKFYSDWKRKYEIPNISYHNIKTFNPNIHLKNIFKFESIKKFKGQTLIEFDQDKSEYNIKFENNEINITSPNKKNINFGIDSNILLNPFYFKTELMIKNKKIENIIDNYLLKLLLYDENYLGNLNGTLKVKFDELNNRLVKYGEIDLIFNEKKIIFKEAKFILDKIGNLVTNVELEEDQGNFKFIFKNELFINNHIEFAKVFQVGSRKIKKIKKIDFDIEKNIGEKNFTISNIKINNVENNKISELTFLIRNIQNLRSNIRKVID